MSTGEARPRPLSVAPDYRGAQNGVGEQRRALAANSGHPSRKAGTGAKHPTVARHRTVVQATWRRAHVWSVFVKFGLVDLVDPRLFALGRTVACVLRPPAPGPGPEQFRRASSGSRQGTEVRARRRASSGSRPLCRRAPRSVANSRPDRPGGRRPPEPPRRGLLHEFRSGGQRP